MKSIVKNAQNISEITELRNRITELEGLVKYY